jgi:ankyrin repeat protein
MKHYIYNAVLSEDLFKRVQHKKDIDCRLNPKEIFDTIIAASVDIKFYQNPWHIPGFTLGCFKKEQKKVRYFFLYHDGSDNVIVFPKYTVDKNDHSCTQHYQWLRKILPSNKVQEFFKHFTPVVEQCPTENVNSNAVILQGLNQPLPLTTISAALNTLTTFQSAKSVESLCIHTAALATIAARTHNEPKEFECIHQVLCNKWRQCLEQTYAPMLLNFDGNNVILQFGHGSRQPKTFALGKKQIAFWQHLLEALCIEYTNSIMSPPVFSFVVLSCRLHPQLSFDLFAKHCTAMPPELINDLLLEVIQATMQEGRLEYHAVENILSIMQQNTILHLIHKENVLTLLRYIVNDWNFHAIYEPNAQVKNQKQTLYLATIEKLLPYASAQAIALIIKPNHAFLTLEIVNAILTYTKQLFSYEKIVCLLSWLKTTNSNHKKSKSIMDQLYTDFNNLPNELKESIQPMLQTYAFLQHHDGFKKYIRSDDSMQESIRPPHKPVATPTSAHHQPSVPKEAISISNQQKQLQAFMQKYKEIPFFSESTQLVMITTQNQQAFFSHVVRYGNLCRQHDQTDHLQWFFEQFIEKSLLAVNIKQRKNAIDTQLNIIELSAILDETKFLNILYNICANTSFEAKLKAHIHYALIYAAYCQKKNSVHLLLHRYQADPNAVIPFSGATALFYAMTTAELQRGYTTTTQIADLLLDAGADPDCATWSGMVPLQLAVIYGNDQATQRLLERGANPHVQIKAHKGMNVSLLDIAKGKKNVSDTMIRLLQVTYKVGYVVGPILVAMSVNPTPENQQALVHTDRHDVATHGIQASPELGKYMIFLKQYLDTSEPNIYKTRAITIMKFFQKQPAYINANPNLALPFLFAVIFQQDTQTLEKFLRDFSPCLGLTAIFCGNTKVDIEYHNILMPLHFAIEHEFHNGVEPLLKKGSSVDLLDEKNGYAPLHLAIVKKDVQTVEILLQYNVDVNQYTRDGDTPLHLAVKDSLYHITLLLLQAGADVEKPGNNNQKTALQIAKENGDDDMLGLLHGYQRDDNQKQGCLSPYLFLKNAILHENINNDELKQAFTSLFSYIMVAVKENIALFNYMLNKKSQGETIFHTAMRLKNYDTLSIILTILQATPMACARSWGRKITVHIDPSSTGHDGKTLHTMVADAIATAEDKGTRNKLLSIQELLQFFGDQAAALSASDDAENIMSLVMSMRGALS